jgi:uncharacterized protein (TIGR03437 family)
MLNGAYYVRQVLWQIGDSSGDLGDAAAVYGEIVFDGNGHYSFSGQVMDPGVAATPQPSGTIIGTYTISASGYGFMDNLLITGEIIYGLVSAQGIFIGSSTENLSAQGVNDLAIMAPIPSPPATAATFNGSYTIVDFDSPTGSPQDSRDSLFTINTSGNGTLSASGSGYIAGNGGVATRQTLGSTKVVFSNGAGNIEAGGNSLATISNNGGNPDAVLISGNYYVYISPDGNFIFGGSPNGWDMFVGVRNSATAANFGGLFYQAGMDQDESELAAEGFANLDSYFGSFDAVTGGTIIGHQRLLSVFNNNPYDFTYSDAFSISSTGTDDDADTDQHYVFGLNGALRIGIGNSPLLGINVALSAPGVSGTGVWIDPQGIVNSGSFAPFTSQIVPGELISLFGSGLSQKTDSNPFFPLTLDGVQVMINGIAAPVYVVSPGFLTVMVPYETTAAIANVQVFNNNSPSNVVSMFTGATQPGILTQTENGVGYAEAQDVTTNYTLITPSSPAQAGDSIVVYLTGLGAMNPAVADGAVGPTPAASTVNTIAATIGGVTATVLFSGLTPGADGLGQVNLTVPSGLTAGANIVEIQGPDSDNFEALISIGTGTGALTTTAQAKPAVRPLMARTHPAAKRNPALPEKIKPFSKPIDRTPGVRSTGGRGAVTTSGSSSN